MLAATSELRLYVSIPCTIITIAMLLAAVGIQARGDGNAMMQKKGDEKANRVSRAQNHWCLSQNRRHVLLEKIGEKKILSTRDKRKRKSGAKDRGPLMTHSVQFCKLMTMLMTHRSQASSRLPPSRISIRAEPMQPNPTEPSRQSRIKSLSKNCP